MKPIAIIFLSAFLFSCNSPKKKVEIDTSKHVGLVTFDSEKPFKVLYSEGHLEDAEKQAELIDEAYQFLSDIMGPKEHFCLMVISEKDWERNAYLPIPGMPGYYKGNLTLGAGHNSMALVYEEMIKSFPEEMTHDLVKTYTNAQGAFDMRLFFDKLSIHELTHSFQDPENQEGYSMSRWLEEIHANMGLYAFYKSKKPNELKYVTHLVDFSLDNPPPNLQYETLSDFDAHYYDMQPDTYGFYQMKFTKAGAQLIDSLGNAVLKPLNDFIIKYDESWKDKLTEEEFRERLTAEVHPYFSEIMDIW
ncbi:MAG: hypothetical protein AAGD88_02445 [Bacteroidota bacterium]